MRLDVIVSLDLPEGTTPEQAVEHITEQMKSWPEGGKSSKYWNYYKMNVTIVKASSNLVLAPEGAWDEAVKKLGLEK